VTRVLVLGAGGMLGHDAVRLAGDAALALDRAACDVTHRDAVRAAVARARPAAVLNCAAWTDVDGAETEPEQALRVNGEGAANVAEAAAEAGAIVLYVSSDYVFDGAKREPYLESDPTRPLSSYGRSKLAGEQATAAANPRHFVVRSSWLFGAHGKNFVAKMLASDRDELRVVDDQVGCPTYTGHLAEGIFRLVSGGDFGIHHIAGGGQCSWFELARATFERAGLDKHVEPCTSDEFPRPAPRPAWSVLRSERPGAIALPPWEAGLDAFLRSAGSARLGRVRSEPV
jgi:dTDP-4-dehydrorhamnose reductase